MFFGFLPRSPRLRTTHYRSPSFKSAAQEHSCSETTACERPRSNLREHAASQAVYLPRCLVHYMILEQYASLGGPGYTPGGHRGYTAGGGYPRRTPWGIPQKFPLGIACGFPQGISRGVPPDIPRGSRQGICKGPPWGIPRGKGGDPSFEMIHVFRVSP